MTLTTSGVTNTSTAKTLENFEIGQQLWDLGKKGSSKRTGKVESIVSTLGATGRTVMVKLSCNRKMVPAGQLYTSKEAAMKAFFAQNDF